MPSVSKAQGRLMAAAAHTKGGYGGVPQKVGKEFNKADAGTDILSGSEAAPLDATSVATGNVDRGPPAHTFKAHKQRKPYA